MTEERLREIEERCEAATGGPWESHEEYGVLTAHVNVDCGECNGTGLSLESDEGGSCAVRCDACDGDGFFEHRLSVKFRGLLNILPIRP